MSSPTLKDLKPDPKDLKLIQYIREKNMEAGYKLLKHINSEYVENNNSIHVVTSESLTAGLIMSSLVDIPFAGWCKYGCFGVYDTDAKRVFNGVEEDNVYTHQCAKEMAVGCLTNSNASLAISVTGNARPYPDNIFSLGEVFIGIAGYTKIDGKYVIVYETYAINTCLYREKVGKEISNLCKYWIEKHKDGRPTRKETYTVSLLIRTYTSYKALSKALVFVKNHKIVTPDFVLKRKQENEKTNNQLIHCNIPKPKYIKKLDQVDRKPSSIKKSKKLNKTFAGV